MDPVRDLNAPVALGVRAAYKPLASTPDGA